MKSVNSTQVKVARIGKPHGIQGWVTIEELTDQPELRFQIGNQFHLLSPDFKKSSKILTLSGCNLAGSNSLLAFAEINNRDEAEKIRNHFLSLEIELPATNLNSDDFHVQQIIGLKSFFANGEECGEVVEVLNLPFQDCLAIKRGKQEILIPFVKELVPTVDISNSKIIFSFNEKYLTSMENIAKVDE